MSAKLLIVIISVFNAIFLRIVIYHFMKIHMGNVYAKMERWIFRLIKIIYAKNTLQIVGICFLNILYLSTYIIN